LPISFCRIRNLETRHKERGRTTWQGKITKDNEYILFIKTQAKRYPELEKALVTIHPYEVPEVIAVPLIQGFGKYLNWLSEETDPDR